MEDQELLLQMLGLWAWVEWEAFPETFFFPNPAAAAAKIDVSAEVFGIFPDARMEGLEFLIVFRFSCVVKEREKSHPSRYQAHCR